jgi:hypothetical protein
MTIIWNHVASKVAAPFVEFVPSVEFVSEFPPEPKVLERKITY